MTSQTFDCDLCGSADYTVLEVARKYIGDNEPPVVCDNCGFCYVRTRRPAKEIAEDWNNIFGKGYTSEWPGVKGRLFYVAEFFDQKYGWKGKRVLDIGAGEGTFLKFIQQRDAWVSGLDPSIENCAKIEDLGARAYCQTVEDPIPEEKFDVVTILWTLENCQDCMGMLEFARECLNPDGKLMVATGSRILVPFKKQLQDYLSKNPSDTHCFRFSRNSLAHALNRRGFQWIDQNDWYQSDVLLLVAEPIDVKDRLFISDRPGEVASFFDSWDREFP